MAIAAAEKRVDTGVALYCGHELIKPRLLIRLVRQASSGFAGPQGHESIAAARSWVLS